MTRAKDRLYLTLAKRRSRFGRTTNREISPFVKDIEQRLLTREAWAPITGKENRINLSCSNSKVFPLLTDISAIITQHQSSCLNI